MTASLRSKRVWIAAGVAVAWAFLAVGARAAGRAETLEAIHGIENPRNSPKPGKHGELGAYQFRPATWRMHTKVPFARALDRRISDEVAVRHYEWLKRGLVRNGLDPTPYNIGLAWNAGLSATVRNRASSSAHDYAQRVSNLAHDFGATSTRLASVR